ncbi:DUF1837 domain-containing protein [Chryseobacterium lacus]|uniref:DUF1837 domain-containing protein n=1 Tax=Chryseobacterium lacus TaxID=2058346 RepID=A0A368N1C2_9FLAO|nr:DUF1837 domain-containing protein [Chryseobacterium lacus]RCU43059.1 DUF1837 domain-containing protein [Chryseobacterium lacus]RST27907.1 DUF1837 domain-containing protein [Chryseobacterium lacus]
MDKYLTNTEKLVNHIYWFYEDLETLPKKDHYGLSINYTDLKERKDDFLSELTNTVVSWVYNNSKSKDLFDKRFAETSDYGNAANFLTNQAYKKFRKGYPQGQFGELLLFNLIQHYYKAVPILRKQRITTSVGHERFGADAIHYKKQGDDNVFILGESKCYESKYSFSSAFETSLNSVVTTFDLLDKEIDLYLYDDFLEPELEDVVKTYKAGKLPDVKFELVCMVVYNETTKITGENEKSIKEAIKTIIKNRCKSFDQEKFKIINEALLTRINYIVFPIWELDVLLDAFQSKVGS